MSTSTVASRQPLTWIFLMAALIAVGAFLQISTGPVPLSMQTFFVLLAGMVLGPVEGGLAVAIYLFAGLVGLPVFAGGTSGLAKLLGPTGGFLLGFLPAAVIASFATRNPSRQLHWLQGILWGGSSTVVIICFGVTWLKMSLDKNWGEALAIGCLPFLPGAILKLIAGILLYRFLHTMRLLPPGQNRCALPAEIALFGKPTERSKS